MFKLILVLIVTITGVGCATTDNNRGKYNQQSPMIKTVEDSGYTKNDRRVEGSVRYREYTSVGTALMQAGEVMITFTFEFKRGKNGADPKIRNCLMHVKSSDTSFNGVKKCHMETSGGTFMVLFTTDKYGPQSFDLYQLPGGHWVGRKPPYNFGFLITVGDPDAVRRYRFEYIGKDPFNK